MKIAVIGAGLSGATAGAVLAEAGHQVVLYEKSRGSGGRLSTRRLESDNGHVSVDHGNPYLRAETPEFAAFLKELQQKGVLRIWEGQMGRYETEKGLFEADKDQQTPVYIAANGMNTVIKHLTRRLEVLSGQKISGLTNIASSSSKKRPWVLNTPSMNVFEADAVVVAVPAVQAYGLVSTAQDEPELRYMITRLDEVSYTASYSTMAGYSGLEPFPFRAITCNHPVLSFITCENSKRDISGEQVFIAQTTDAFTRSLMNEREKSDVEPLVLQAMGEVLGAWAARPNWSQTHLWRYRSPRKPLSEPYLVSNDQNAPLAVTGDYFQGTTAEAAYISGLRLGKAWAELYS